MQSQEGPTNSNIEILIVEDSPTQALRLRHILERHGFSTKTVNNGLQALALMEDSNPAVVISDILMPEMNGYELCRHIKSSGTLKDTPVILLTSLSDTGDIIKGLECGADSFVLKPYEEKRLLTCIQNILDGRLDEHDKGQEATEVLFAGKKYCISLGRQRILDILLSTYEIAVQKNRDLTDTQNELELLNEQLEKKVRERTAELEAEITERKKAEEELKQSFKKLERTMRDTINAMARIVETRDPYTAGHQQRVASLACAIAKEMGLSKQQIKTIYMAAAIHDIGKIYIPAEILSKPGRLSEVEFSMIKAHAEYGYEILKAIEFPWPIAKVVLQHHEKADGTGYPQGLFDHETLLEAKIVAVADVVEAMASHRPYRPALGMDSALEEISQWRGTLYDAKVVDACLSILIKRGFSFIHRQN